MEIGPIIREYEVTPIEIPATDPDHAPERETEKEGESVKEREGA